MLDRHMLTCVAETLETGEQTRLNHSDCEAGEDTRQRLYIRKTSRFILGFCHNCQQTGSVYIGSEEPYRLGVGVEPEVVVEEAKEYKPCFTVPLTDPIVPPNVRFFVEKNSGASHDVLDICGVAYAPHEEAIHTPIASLIDGVLVNNGYQLRPINKGEHGSKYVTHMREDAAMGGLLLPTTSSVIAVIVEDYFSAIRIRRCGFNAYCNYGVQVKPTALVGLMGTPTIVSVIVWLDNDNATVRQAALDIAQVTHLVTGLPTYLEMNHSDPKRYTDKEILEIIDRVYTNEDR